MELRQLEYLVAVVDEAGFTRAAQRLHVAQPGVSAQVRRLERELGQELLDRSGRSVRPTAVGEAVLPHARAALAAAERIRLAADELAGLLRGRLAIGSVTSHRVDLPGLLAGFHADHPAVDITLAEDSTDRLVSAVRDGRLDAAIIAYGEQPPEGLGTLVVADEPITAAVGRADPWAARSSVPLAALGARSLVCLPPGTGIRSLLEDACAAAGFAPRVALEAGTPGMLAELAARGLGTAVLPASVATAHPDLHALPITTPALRGRLAFAWRTTGPSSPAAQALVRRAREALGGPAAPGAGEAV